MGRHSGGWKLRQAVTGGVWYVRFTIAGRTHELSTGTRDYEEARKAAARIYAHHVQQAPVRRATRGMGGPLEELVGEWIASLESTHDAGTLKTWELYAGAHWMPRWLAVTDISGEAVIAYRDARLKVVKATTVRKELSALRSFLRFLQSPVTVASVPMRAIGVAYRVRRRATAPELSPDQTRALIAALPEWSTSRKVKRFAIRARFLVGYETSLRPSTLDRIEAPKHYRRGSSTLLLTPDVDKVRFARELPLSQVARDALDAVTPDAGHIFGHHDYREHLEAAAEATLPPDVAARFAGTHLRSARITHLLEQTGNLPGVQYLAGHRLASTTAIYVKPSLRAAREALGLGAPKKRPKRPKRSKSKSS